MFLWRRRSQSLSQQAIAVAVAAEEQAPLRQQQSSRQLQQSAEELVGQAVGSGANRSDETVVSALALFAESLRRTTGVKLYHVQLQAAAALICGAIVEMQTGEGKTYAAAAAAFVWSLAKRGVHVATANSYLAQRDAAALAPVFAALGTTAVLLPERVPSTAKEAAYLADITYGSGYEFGFDFLRDQLAASGSSRSATVWTNESRSLRAMQRRWAYAIVDEADHVLLDEAGMPLVLSEAYASEAPDAALRHTANQLSQQLLQKTELREALGRVKPRWSRDTWELIHAVPIDTAVLAAPWIEYVEQAIVAHWQFQAGRDYVVREGHIQLVDRHTGRIFPDRVWNLGLHQAVEAKEGLRVTPERVNAVAITRQQYFRKYATLSGVTGTGVQGAPEFRTVYQLPVISIPTHRPSQRRQEPDILCRSASERWQAIIDQTKTRLAAGRPVLIGVRSIVDSQLLAQRLADSHVIAEVINGLEDAREAEQLARAGSPCAVTIATNVAGRGADIPLAPPALAAGGLHVIVSQPYDSERVERQLLGRAARQGQPGSTQRIISADDLLWEEHGREVAEMLRAREKSDAGFAKWIAREVSRAQLACESRQAAARIVLAQAKTQARQRSAPRPTFAAWSSSGVHDD